MCVEERPNKSGGKRKISRDRKDVDRQVWREEREQALREGVGGAGRGQVWWDRAGVVWIEPNRCGVDRAE